MPNFIFMLSFKVYKGKMYTYCKRFKGFPLSFQLERSFKFMRETEDQLKVIPQFCFPDAKDWAPVDSFPR